ncbi:Uncharacterised protein [Mycobacteroides abscessus subsp. abscessus]|nr:Uncharacterised protein [Mycobacteroides abscessus subsp. abscessus]
MRWFIFSIISLNLIPRMPISSFPNESYSTFMSPRSTWLMLLSSTRIGEVILKETNKVARITSVNPIMPKRMLIFATVPALFPELTMASTHFSGTCPLAASLSEL